MGRQTEDSIVKNALSEVAGQKGGSNGISKTNNEIK